MPPTTDKVEDMGEYLPHAAAAADPKKQRPTVPVFRLATAQASLAQSGPRASSSQKDEAPESRCIGSDRMFNSIRLFLRVVQDGSLSAAGKSFDLSPASVSRRIAALEADLGVQLFNRTSRKVVLTDAGETYYQRIKVVVEEFQDVQNSARQMQDDAQGLLRIHSRTSVGIQLIAPGIKEFCELYPNVTVELQLSETPVNLMDKNFDVDIRLGELEDSSFLVRKLASSDRILVASPSYLASHPPIEKPEDLLQHNCLTYRLDSEATSWRFAKEGEPAREMKIAGGFHTNNAEVLRRVTLTGLGVSLLTDWGIYADLQSGALAQVLPEYRTTNYTFTNGIYAVFRQTRYVPRKVRVFVDFMVERMKVTQKQ